MNKSITIITSEESFENNYGAILQGYALFTKLKNLGYLPRIVRYQGGEFRRNKYLYTLFCIKREAGKIYRSIIHSNNPPKMITQSLNPNSDRAEERKQLFLAFEREFLLFTSEKRFTYHQLEANPPISDYYICGSDQIWNPYFKEGRNDPGYFLAFAPKGAVKISYAPSFGCSDLPDKAKTDLRALLSTFKAISVREKTGVDIIKKYAHLDAELVLDPTMLLTPEQWKSIAQLPKKIPEKYILCYRFADSKQTKALIDEISSILKIPVISLPLSKVAMEDDYSFVFEAGPREFIGLIKNASLVCTDSFHATVFSILMKTPVCVFLRENYQSGNSMNTRIFSLLEMLSLQNLVITETDTVDKMINCLSTDYDEAHKRLTERRIESENFLINALMGKENA